MRFVDGQKVDTFRSSRSQPTPPAMIGPGALLQVWIEFGKDAFEFILIEETATLGEARGIENELIGRYQTFDPQRGYNHMHNGRWSPAARLRNTEKKLIAKRKYMLLPGVSLDDPMMPDFVQSAKKGHHE